MAKKQPQINDISLSLDSGWQGIVADWSTDQQVFQVPWGKAMMWLFLLSDTFIFGCLLIAYMTARLTATEPWPITSEVFALTIAGKELPLILIAIMTFILISSSGTMAMAVNVAYSNNSKQQKEKTAAFIFVTALFGLSFVGMQAFEWSKLILEEGLRPWANPLGAAQFGACFFMITGFHGLHVSAGVIYLFIVAFKVYRGDCDNSVNDYTDDDLRANGKKQVNNYTLVEVAGLYWHFVDLVWVFIFAFFYLW